LLESFLIMFHNDASRQAGGNSCYTRMADRVHNELAALNGTRTRIKVVAQPENDRRMSAWLGGSIVGSLAGFHEMWMSKAVRHANFSNLKEADIVLNVGAVDCC